MTSAKRVGCLLMLAGWGLGAVGEGSPAEPKPVEWFIHVAAASPNSAVELLRRADEMTNLRMPGAAPFHMKVTFHAFPGMNFAKPGKSDIITGSGTYEEWWLSPERWRREVTFGNYHAIEARTEGVRKFRANSAYEPSRVLMILNELYATVPRWLLEPELEKHPPQWRLQRFGVPVPYMELTWIYPADAGVGTPEGTAYDLLESGIPVRSVESGLVTTWREDVAFHGRIVPEHIEIHAVGKTLLTADVSVADYSDSEGNAMDMSGDAAQPGQTLRPLDFHEVKVGPYVGYDPVQDSETWGGDHRGSGLHIRCVYDQAGLPHEVEVIDTHPEVGAKGEAELPDYLIDTAKRMVTHIQREVRVRVTIDGNPCEWAGGFVTGGG